MMSAPASAGAQARQDDPVAPARQLYNERRFDEAIAAATVAARVSTASSAAAVVLARAHLERFRQSGEADSLGAAREALKGVDVSGLSPRDHVEYLIGLGQSLYLDEETRLDDRYAAAAEFFEVALNRADVLDARGRDMLFDWWAMSLDQQAQQNPTTTRPPLYERILARAETEVARPDAPASALYWLAAGAAGTNDAQRAWGAAVAGWIRSGSLGPRGETVRADLGSAHEPCGPARPGPPAGAHGRPAGGAQSNQRAVGRVQEEVGSLSLRRKLASVAAFLASCSANG